MSETVLKLIKPANQLDKSIHRNNIVQTIANEIKKFAHLTSPTSADVIQFIGALIENLISKKDKFDKKEIFIDVLRSAFSNITTEEIALAILIVQSLLDNKVIKKYLF
jgi:hypothetical protein